MLYGIVGKKGCGKTLLLTYLLKKYSEEDKNINVYTNYRLSNINFKKINFKELFENDAEIKNAVLGIDEIYTIADCRTSMTKMNRLISYMLFQTRKSGVDIFYTAVSFNTIEKRLRNHTDGLFFPNLFIGGKKVLNPETITRKKMNYFIDKKIEIKIKGLYCTDYDTKKFEIPNPQELFKYYSSYEIIKPEI